MRSICILVAMASFCGAASSQEMSKLEFISVSGKQLTDALCEFERFLECVDDSEELCRAQMNALVVPHCLEKNNGLIPEMMAEEQAQEVANELKKCVATAYLALNQVDANDFQECIVK